MSMMLKDPSEMSGEDAYEAMVQFLHSFPVEARDIVVSQIKYQLLGNRPRGYRKRFNKILHNALRDANDRPGVGVRLEELRRLKGLQ